MSYETISVEIEGQIAVIRLNRPKVMNALNRKLRAELTEAVREAGQTARVVVLTAEGSAFCSGQDLTDGASLAEPDLARILEEEYVPMLNAIVHCSVPTIAAVNGPAAGAGASLALCTDVVIATESAYFLQAFSRIGLVPDAGGTYWTPRAMGSAKAMGAALFGEKITARQADDWGLIWQAVADSEFEATWKARAAQLAAGPTLAYREIKSLMRGSWGQDLDGQLSAEGQAQDNCGRSADFREGVMAFVQKRVPDFSGS